MLRFRHLVGLLVAPLVVGSPVASAATGDVWTVAGGGLREFDSGVQIATGDGGSAVQATLLNPSGLTVADDGTIVVADSSSGTIRLVFPDGSIDTVAGTVPGFSGDGGPAVNARFSGPRDVEIAPDGGLIVADSGNNRLRRIGVDGIVTTIAGTLQPGPGPNGDGGPLSEAKLQYPSGVAFGPSGDMYVREGSSVRRVVGGVVSTWVTGLSSTGDIDVDGAGNLFVPDGNVIWRVDASGQKTVFAGSSPGSSADGVPATDAQIDGAYHVAVGPGGDVYITTSGRIRRISGGTISTVAGGGTAADATGCLPATRAQRVDAGGLAFDPLGDLVVSSGQLVRVIALSDRACPSITPVTPTRLLDTRSEVGQIGFAGPRPTPGQTVVVRLSSATSPVPLDATAAALNLTVTGSSNDGYVTAWPCEAPRPLASNINVTSGGTAANSVLVALGPSNEVCLFDQAGGDLIVDVTGFIGFDVPYQPLLPYRALETRATQGQFHYAGVKPVAGEIVRVPITGWGYGDNSVSPFASSVVLNVTATDATADGYVTVWACDGPPPNASNLNVTTGGTVAHLVVAQLPAGVSPQKSICLFTQSGAHLVVDILGAFMPDAPFVGVAPRRVLETRAGVGQIGFSGGQPKAGDIVEVDVASAGSGIPATARAVVLNVTATGAPAPGFITVWPCGIPRPLSSSLNLSGAGTQSNSVVVGLGQGGRVCIYTQGGADLIADVNGFFA